MAQIEAYALLEAPPRADLVALAEVAALVADVPMATVNLITDTEQHQIATAAFETSICAREDSMCAVVLDEAVSVIVSDARPRPAPRSAASASSTWCRARSTRSSAAPCTASLTGWSTCSSWSAPTSGSRRSPAR